MSPLRVVHIIAPIHYGGGESLLVNLLSCQDPTITPFVLTLTKSITFEKQLHARYISHRPLSPISLGHGVSKTKILLITICLLIYFPLFIIILVKQKPDVVHIHGFPSCIFGFLSRPFHNAKLVYTHHFVRKPPSLVEAYFLILFYSSTAFTAPSDHVLQSFIQSFH